MSAWITSISRCIQNVHVHNCREVLSKLASDENWGDSWCFDDVSNLYMPVDILPPDKKTTYKLTLGSGPQAQFYNVEIGFASKVDLSELQRWVR